MHNERKPGSDASVTGAPADTGRVLDSAALLGRHDEVLIRHEGRTYRLRRTRLGKLILTA